MISYIASIFNYLFGQNNLDNDDDATEKFLAEQILDIEIGQEIQNHNETWIDKELPKESVCFKRTGIITYINNDDILIDGALYFNISSCNLNLRLKDKVLYLGYKKTDNSAVIARILENHGTHWDDENVDNVDENKFKVIEHVIVGEVDYRQDRFVHMKEKDLMFSLDEVEATVVPVKGDWLELYCRVQWDDENPSNICGTQVLNVISIRPLRSKMKQAVVTEWTGENGICDRTIYFSKQCLQGSIEPCVGSKVILEAIESNQGACVWRATKLILTENVESKNLTPIALSPEDQSLLIEQERNIDITHTLVFDKVNINETATIDLNVTNNSDQTYVINKWIVLSKRRDSQIDINPALLRPVKLYPKQTFMFTIHCRPKFLGSSKEHMIIMFKGFQIHRMVTMNIINNIPVNNHGFKDTLSHSEKIKKMRQIRNRSDDLVRAQTHTKPPAFISVRLGNFDIPDKIWSIFLGDSNQTAYCSEFEKILYNIENHFPCLSKTLNIANYVDRWHTLLYMEEIQANIDMRTFDMANIYLIRCEEYLGVEINGLSERRPSLIKGDRAIVKDSWDENAQKYEGYVHKIKGNLVLMKFNSQFHNSYSGSDLSIEFHSTRTSFRRSHQAVNLAISNLGVDILFPSRILNKPHQVIKEKIDSIKWYNNLLNAEQKEAVSNILLGECRPMPYCIYGPPGTGKTMTVIETILQISNLVPESRILVATPSNSAANLITERLLKYRKIFSGSIIRIIANYLLDNDNIPEVIKPYCATLDIGIENTKESFHVVKNKMNLNCQKSFVGRHRIIIGTCFCLGTLTQMGFPRGHFTHVIVDEAGQATEPEVMIPLSFIDKENGQIILAGDPMQLGPVLMSKYCKEFAMGESYFSRIMETFPYQKDYNAFGESHFNNKLITRLKDNYRSLQEVLTLPSAMFYDASLVSKIDRGQTWVQTIINTISEIFELSDSSTGGIYVYGIRGCNVRAEDSPSWYNPQEASMIALTTCKLYKKNISINDIGLVTPYIAQVKYIRVLFNAMGLPLPKVGSVEEFQGQEKPIIIISTVRSSETYLQEDKRNTLGFVKNPKRMNVALTRAQVAVLLFCDPHLLSSDPLWKRVIECAVRDDKFIGCDLPSHICK